MSKTVADLLVERLIEWNVDTIFGIPGDGINGIFEALRIRQDKIKFIQVRHEESAALAACGYSKFTGRLGVCLATSGPGGVHLLNGLYDAKCDGHPVLAITGHTFHDLIGTDYQQDVDLDKLFMDVAAFSQRISGPAHVKNMVDAAIKTSLGHHTVSHLNIPKDVQGWASTDDVPSHANVPKHSSSTYVRSYPHPPPTALAAAAEVINSGSRVAILAGRGALGCGNELLQLAEKTGAPVIKALLGKGAVPDTSPYTTGGIGLLGTAPSQDAMEECDTLIIVGSGFPYIEFYPKPGQARTVQIDMDSSRIGLRQPVEVGLIGDSATVLSLLLPLIEKKENRDFLERAQGHMASWNDLLEEQGTRDDVPMKPQVVTFALNKLLDDDAIIAVDSGTITTWAARYIDMRGSMQFSVSGSLATMANALPYSIGAAVAYPGRQVLCIVGDGGLSMLMGDIATLVKYQLPVKVIVLKNDMLGQIKWEQLVTEGNPEYGVELQPIDFAGVARCCGATGYTIQEPSQVEAVLRHALSEPGPCVVECIVDPLEPPMPGKISTHMALQFAKALARGEPDRWDIIKTVLKNKVREVL